jgi:hypothetical protein
VKGVVRNIPFDGRKAVRKISAYKVLLVKAQREGATGSRLLCGCGRMAEERS